jgi:hypothetical protein
MADTRNTATQIAEAMKVARTVVKSRPKHVRDLAAALQRDGEKGGFAEPVLAMCDAVLMAASKKASEAARYKGDSPRGGDLEREANALLGIYEQLYAAFTVAARNGG